METLTLAIIFKIIIAHYLGDWLFQTHWMSQKKSSSLVVLSKHVGVYTLTLFLVLFMIVPHNLAIGPLLIWTALNGFLHFIVDFFTSKLTACFWRYKEYRAFFLTIGSDQLLHYAFLFLTAIILL